MIDSPLTPNFGKIIRFQRRVEKNEVSFIWNIANFSTVVKKLQLLDKNLRRDNLRSKYFMTVV